MITEGQRFLERAWWIALASGPAITLTVLSVNLSGDWVRDFFDPKLKQLEPLAMEIHQKLFCY